MIITLIVLSLLLGGYSLYLIKKLDKDIFSLLKDVPVSSEEERAELMKSLGLD